MSATDLQATLNRYDYDLPKQNIANTPASPRDHSKLMVLNRHTQSISHHHFYELPQFLTTNDVLVLNQTKVFPARIRGTKTTGGKVEILLLKQLAGDTWEVMSKPSLKPDQQLNFQSHLTARVVHKDPATGYAHLKFNLQNLDLLNQIFALGLTPLPPYIENSSDEQTVRDQYQTVYAQNLGSSAAPTAGLHFTQSLLQTIKSQGVAVEYITLHVGPGTFQNLREENLAAHKLHQEDYIIDPTTASRLTQYKHEGRRIISVGTTTTRTLESSYQHNQIQAGPAFTEIFIYPPYQFHFVNALITNFHLPKSSLLMLVSALTAQPNTDLSFTDFSSSFIGQAYHLAVAQNYRFFSFGDAMFIQ